MGSEVRRVTVMVVLWPEAVRPVACESGGSSAGTANVRM